MIFPSGINLTKREADRPYPYNYDVRNAWKYTFTIPSVFITRCFSTQKILALPCSYNTSSPLNLNAFVDEWFSLPHSLTHGAEPFLRSRQLCSYSRTSQHFYGTQRFITALHKPSTGPYPEPNRSNPYNPILPL
jgi:hypothetical protein